MANRDDLIIPFCCQELPGRLEKRRIDDEERDAHEMSLDHLYASLMHKTCTRDAHHMLCPVSIIKRQVQRTSCHKSPTPHHLTPTCHPTCPICLQMSPIQHQLFCVTWLLQVQHKACRCNMTDLYVAWLMHVWRDSFTCDMTHSGATTLNYVWNDPLMCDMTHICAIWRIQV